MTTYIFDGSFEGLLTSIFEFYERKPGKIELVSQSHFQPMMLGETFEVISDEAKSKRVWTGLKKKISHDWQTRFYKTFLSETNSFSYSAKVIPMVSLLFLASPEAFHFTIPPSISYISLKPSSANFPDALLLLPPLKQ